MIRTPQKKKKLILFPKLDEKRITIIFDFSNSQRKFSSFCFFISFLYFFLSFQINKSWVSCSNFILFFFWGGKGGKRETYYVGRGSVRIRLPARLVKLLWSCAKRLRRSSNCLSSSGARLREAIVNSRRREFRLEQCGYSSFSSNNFCPFLEDG